VKYATFPLGLAILMASVGAAAAEPYTCPDGTQIELSAEGKGNIVSYSVLPHLPPEPRRQVDHRVQIARDKNGVVIVRLNGKRCEVGD
jgi:hypothetical protein